jgi:small subunit ribosomal protein S20
MANTKSAAKRARQNQRRSVSNRRVLTAVKNQLRNLRAAIQGGKKDTLKTASQQFVSAIDKAVKAGRIHRNAANRHKSALNKALAGAT